MNADDQAMERLRADHPGWRIWRAVRTDGRLGEWVATLHDPRVGVAATVMEPSPAKLNAALIEERDQVEAEDLR